MYNPLLVRSSNRCSHRSRNQLPNSVIRSLWANLPINQTNNQSINQTISHQNRAFSSVSISRSISSKQTISRTTNSFHQSIQQPSRSVSNDALAEKKARYDKHVGLTRVRLSLKAGKGGAGCSAFHRDLSGRGTVHGSPSGGNGGPGGSIYITCSSDLSINQFDFGVHHYNAGNGERGSGKARVGARGDDLHIRVPPNTRVYMIREEINEEEEESDNQSKILKSFNGHRVEYLIDMTKGGTSLLLCKGGNGGFGNRSLMSDSSTFNKFSSTGDLGEGCEILLEMTVMADVGCVGFPNAGKSSLLDALTRSQPKIASYPFTTIRPEVGVVEVDQSFNQTNNQSENPFLMPPVPASSMTRLTLADLPGLVEDAHRNIGLGHSFLAHLQRCSVLVYVIDCSGAAVDQTKKAGGKRAARDPSEDFLALRRELRLYDNTLIEKPWLVLANQMDRKPATANKNLIRLKQVVESELAVERMNLSSKHAENETDQSNDQTSDQSSQSVTPVLQSLRARVMKDWTVDEVCIAGSCLDRRGLDRCVEQMKRLVDGVNSEQAKDDAIKRAQEKEQEKKEKEEAALRSRRRTFRRPQRKEQVDTLAV